jgi:hypothetical protein
MLPKLRLVAENRAGIMLYHDSSTRFEIMSINFIFTVRRTAQSGQNRPRNLLDLAMQNFPFSYKLSG